MSTLQASLLNWIPYKLVKQNPALCEWLYTGNKPFTEPFFSDSISACKTLKENSSPYKIISHTDMLEEWSANTGAVEPTAIIFHISRCGSTLFSQLLAADKDHIVLSEVPFFDELLRLPFQAPSFSSNDIARLLKAAICLYGRSGGDKPSRLFIKSDSWHLHFYELLRNLFPATPFILVYRHPWEVIKSQQRRRGMQSVPGIIEPAVFGFNAEKANEINLDKFMAHVLHSYFDKMITITTTDPLALPVNYEEGADRILKNIYSFTQMPLDAAMEAVFNERIRYHAKYPQQLFKEENNTSDLPGFLLPVMKLYRQLDELRVLNY